MDLKVAITGRRAVREYLVNPSRDEWKQGPIGARKRARRQLQEQARLTRGDVKHRAIESRLAW